jgi:DDE superfamily endonuclease
MVHSWGSSTAKGLFCAWKTVSDNAIVSRVNLYFIRYSVLPAISLDKGILHCEIVEGSFRADTFALFIQNLLDHAEPFPGPNSVIVMDNCQIHKNPYIQEMIHAR